MLNESFRTSEDLNESFKTLGSAVTSTSGAESRGQYSYGSFGAGTVEIDANVKSGV